MLAFELASRACFKEACTQGGLKLLEPIMRVEVVTPEDYMGDVIGDEIVEEDKLVHKNKEVMPKLLQQWFLWQICLDI